MTTMADVRAEAGGVPADLAAALRELAPLLQGEGERAEELRRLTDEAVSALKAAGFFRIWVPRALGGMEMDLVPALRIFEELSRTEGAAGWVVGNAAAIHTLCQVLPDETAEEIFATRDAIVAGGWFPPGTAVPVPGGYRVSLQGKFGSGVHHGSFFTGMTVVMEGDAPAVGPGGGPVQMVVFLPPEDVEILDTWHTMGMRGTGSHDLLVSDVFIPTRRTYIVAPIDHPGSAFQGPLYRFGLFVAPIQICVQALGMAQASLDAALSLAQGKTPSYTMRSQADSERAQATLARADAKVRAARAFLYETARVMWAEMQEQKLSLATGQVAQLTASFVGEASAEVVDLVHEVVGTSGMREEHPFERLFRDVHSLQQNAFISQNRYESVGKLMLGRETDWGWLLL